MVNCSNLVKVDIGLQDLNDNIKSITLDELLLQADSDHAVVIPIRRVVWTSRYIVILVGEESLRWIRNRVLLANCSLIRVLVTEKLNEIGFFELLDIVRWLQELMVVAIVHLGSEFSFDEKGETTFG